MNSYSDNFPIGLLANWQVPSGFDLDQQLSDWLLDPNSLTERLEKTCDLFRVDVIGQHTQPCDVEEASDPIVDQQSVLVREVLLYCDNIPHVFARTLIPITSLTGEQEKLSQLGNRSLGKVLFSDPLMQRASIEIAYFSAHSSVARLNKLLNLPNREKLWGRRSLIYVDQKPLLVAEVFLASSLAYS